jgi:Polysaccharide deacetylase
VLVYHDITEDPSEFQRISGGFTSPTELERQIRWLRERFTFISPADLPQLGGRRPLPENAALVTFDDAWKGVFRVGLPLLAALNVPSLCFLNMATVEGFPDLAAVRRYERLCGTPPPTSAALKMDLAAADLFLARVERTYLKDAAFMRFQGETASPLDLAVIADAGAPVWLGSHLYHHWDVRWTSREVLVRSAQRNVEALREHANWLPALATPHGESLDGLGGVWEEWGTGVIFIATGRQNRSPDARVLDRLEVEPAPSEPSDWWWSVHRRRLFGRFAG